MDQNETFKCEKTLQFISSFPILNARAALSVAAWIRNKAD